MKLQSMDWQNIMPFMAFVIFVPAIIPGAFIGGVWAGCGIVGGILAFLLLWAESGNPPVPDARVFFMALAFVLVALASSVFSDYPDIARHTALKIATIALPLSLFSSQAVQSRLYNPAFFKIISTLFIVAMFTLAVELFADTPILHALKGQDKASTEYNRGASYMAILFWPLLAGLLVEGRRRASFLLTLSLLPVLVLTASRATMLAAVVGGLIFITARFAPGVVKRFLQAAAIFSAAWPFGANYIFINHHSWVEKLPTSWHTREEIWDYMYYGTIKKPWMGWGAGVSHKLSYDTPNSLIYTNLAKKASHPHNMFSQLWVETGIVGVFIGIMFLFMTLSWISSLPERLRPYAMAAWSGCFVISLCAYDFWTDSLAAMFALVCIAFVFAARTGLKNEQNSHF